MSGKRHFSHVNGIFTSNMIWKCKWNKSSDIIDGRGCGACYVTKGWSKNTLTWTWKIAWHDTGDMMDGEEDNGQEGSFQFYNNNTV